MAKLILVLEDNTERQWAMRDRLGERLSMYDSLVTDEPRAVIDRIRERPGDVLAVSLDHDLHERPDGSVSATGMEVVDYLVTVPPSFPVLLHTSNEHDGARMLSRLEEAGWAVNWVRPFIDTEWVGADWYPSLKRALRRSAAQERVSHEVHDAD